jgi:hypothetical protein
VTAVPRQRSISHFNQLSYSHFLARLFFLLYLSLSLTMAPPSDGIAAFLTTHDGNKAVICERSRCTIKRFPPGTELYFVSAQNPNAQGEGVYVCHTCYGYYQQKVGTVTRSGE